VADNGDTHLGGEDLDQRARQHFKKVVPQNGHAPGKLSTHIDKAAARSAQFKEEVAQLQNGLSKLASFQAEMDKIRSQEHEALVMNRAAFDVSMRTIDNGVFGVVADDGDTHVGGEDADQRVRQHFKEVV
jgi:molecular chaperone DnaK (HSP70)